MIINLIYFLILLIFIFLIFQSIQAIRRGLKAKNDNKIKNTNKDRNDIVDKISNLKKLLDNGTINKEEFKIAKKKTFR